MSFHPERREFLKKLAKWGVLGVGMYMSGGFLAACSKFAAPANQKPQQQIENGVLYFSNKSLGYYFFIIQQEAIYRSAQARGWEFQSTVADLNALNQSKQLLEILPKKPIAVIIDPVDSDGMEESIRMAKKEGIPVGIIDTPISQGEASITIAFDNYKAGELAGEKVIQLLTKKYGEPKGVVLNCYGQLQSSAWNLRKQGFENALKQHRFIELISRPTEGDLTKMHDVTSEILNQYPFLDAVHAPSETPARGIYQALKENQKLHPKGHEQHVAFVTIDGEPIAHEWIKEGILDATISQDPIAYGEICVELLDEFSLKRTTVPLGPYTNTKYYWEKAEIVESPSGPSLILPPFEVNESNVDDKRLWGNIAFHDWGIKYY